MVKGERLMIYVDRLRPAKWKYKKASHLFSDTSNQELHDFAYGQLGLKKWYFQNKGKYPHYDLSPSMQKKAMRWGAKLVTCRQAIHILKYQRKPKEVIK